MPRQHSYDATIPDNSDAWYGVLKDRQPKPAEPRTDLPRHPTDQRLMPSRGSTLGPAAVGRSLDPSEVSAAAEDQHRGLLLLNHHTCPPSLTTLPHPSFFVEVREGFCPGEMSERPKEHAWKACVSVRVPRVRIPLSPFFPFSVDGRAPCNSPSPNPVRPGREQRSVTGGCATAGLTGAKGDFSFNGIPCRTK